LTTAQRGGEFGRDHDELRARAYNGDPRRSGQSEEVRERSPSEAGDIFILKVHFLRSSCGILHWCNGCTVHVEGNWPHYRGVAIRQIMFDAACLLNGALYGSDSMEVR